MEAERAGGAPPAPPAGAALAAAVEANGGAGNEDKQRGKGGEGEACSIGGGCEAISLPPALFDLTGGLGSILNLDTWSNVLDEDDRTKLRAYLPPDIGESSGGVLEALLMGTENFHFGNPAGQFWERLQGGELDPRVVQYKEGAAFLDKKVYHHSIREYHNNMVTSLMGMKDTYAAGGALRAGKFKVWKHTPQAAPVASPLGPGELKVEAGAGSWFPGGGGASSTYASPLAYQVKAEAPGSAGGTPVGAGVGGSGGVKRKAPDPGRAELSLGGIGPPLPHAALALPPEPAAAAGPVPLPPNLLRAVRAVLMTAPGGVLAPAAITAAVGDVLGAGGGLALVVHAALAYLADPAPPAGGGAPPQPQVAAQVDGTWAWVGGADAADMAAMDAEFKRHLRERQARGEAGLGAGYLVIPPEPPGGAPAAPPPPAAPAIIADPDVRFAGSKAGKTPVTIPRTSLEQLALFRHEETRRYNTVCVEEPFSYTTLGGCGTATVAPVRRPGTKALARPREHALLINNRPSCVTILCLVRDATARMPDAIGTRADVCQLVQDSQYIVPEATESQVNQVVSGALDRLHYERDPCIKYDPEKKLWKYMHAARRSGPAGLADFDADGTVSTKRRRSGGGAKGKAGDAGGEAGAGAGAGAGESGGI